MHRTRAVLSIVLVALGLVWAGQGSGLLKGSSFMVGDSTWLVVGIGCVTAGALLGLVELRRRRT